MTLALVYDHLWQSTVFAAAAGLFTLALRKNRAGVRPALWLAASIKFLIPLAVLIELGDRIPWHRVPSSELSAVVVARSEPFTMPRSSNPAHNGRRGRVMENGEVAATPCSLTSAPT